MEKDIELTLSVLEECCLKGGRASLSIKDLCEKIKVSEKKIKSILSVLENKKYIKKHKGSDKYILTKKIVMLI